MVLGGESGRLGQSRELKLQVNQQPPRDVVPGCGPDVGTGGSAQTLPPALACFVSFSSHDLVLPGSSITGTGKRGGVALALK